MNDRASQRATQQVVRTFGKAQQTLSLAPTADSRGWPKPNENMMLVHRTAVGTSTQQVQVDVHVTNGSPAQIFADLLATGQFNNRLSQWLGAQGLSIRNADGSEAVLPAPPAASTAAASTESTAAAAAAADSTAAATDSAAAADDVMPPLPPVGPILYSTQELDELAG